MLMIPEPNAPGIEISVGKLMSYKSPGIDKIPTEMMQSAGSRVLSDIYIYTHRKKELKRQWRECSTVPIYMRGDKTECSNYRDMSLLSSTYKTSPSVPLSNLTPYIDEIIVDNFYGSRRNTGGQIFYSGQILEKQWQ